MLLLLLLGSLAVGLAINTFHRLALLALGTVPLLVTLHAPSETLIVTLRTVPLCFHPSRLDTLGCVVFVSSTALQLCPRSSHRSRVTPLCRSLGAASLASVTDWSRRCWSMMLNSASGSCTTRLNLISLSTLQRTSSGYIPADICLLYTSPSPRD